MAGRFTEADPGIQPQLADTGGCGQPGPLHQMIPDLGDDIVVAGVLLHDRRIGGHVHGHPSGAGFGGNGPQGGRHVVDDGSSGRDGRPGHPGLARVDRHPHLTRQRLDHGEHPPQFLGLGDRPGARASRLTPDVHDGSPGRNHLPAVLHRRGHVEPLAPVGKRVRRYVEYAHHAGHRSQAIGTNPSGRGRTRPDVRRRNRVTVFCGICRVSGNPYDEVPIGCGAAAVSGRG